MKFKLLATIVAFIVLVMCYSNSFSEVSYAPSVVPLGF